MCVGGGGGVSVCVFVHVHVGVCMCVIMYLIEFIGLPRLIVQLLQSLNSFQHLVETKQLNLYLSHKIIILQQIS